MTGQVWSYRVQIFRLNTVNIQTWYLTPGFKLARRILDMLSAAFTGTVLFSTTILDCVDISAIILAADSMYFKSAARPWNKTNHLATVNFKHKSSWQNVIYNQCRPRSDCSFWSSLRSSLIWVYTVWHVTKYFKKQMHKKQNSGKKME